MMLEKGVWIAVICAWIRTRGIFNLYNLSFTDFMSGNSFWICSRQLYFSYSRYVYSWGIIPWWGKLRDTSWLWWQPSLEGSVELQDDSERVCRETFCEQLIYCFDPSAQFFFCGGSCPKEAENSNLEHKGTAVLTSPLSASPLLFLRRHCSFTKSILSHCLSDHNFYTSISQAGRIFLSDFLIKCSCAPSVFDNF